jgi:hypothetical protein
VSDASKAIATPEEVSLLVQIYIATGHADEAVQLLRGPSLNRESAIGGQDPQLVTSLLLQAATASGKADVILQVCNDLLADEESRNDDRVWACLLESYKHGDDKT